MGPLIHYKDMGCRKSGRGKGSGRSRRLGILLDNEVQDDEDVDEAPPILPLHSMKEVLLNPMIFFNHISFH